MVASSVQLARVYWAATLLVLAAGVVLATGFAPTDASMGLVQKLIYLHIPAAVTAFLATGGVCVGSVAYLWTRERTWDEFACSCAKVVTSSSLVVLITGMVWGKHFWGFWWAWSPKLTFTLLLCVIFAVYLVVRSRVSPSRRAVVCAVFGAVACLDVPLLYLSARLLPDVHPTSMPLTMEMRVTLLTWFAAAIMASAGVTLGPLLQHGGRTRLRHA